MLQQNANNNVRPGGVVTKFACCKRCSLFESCYTFWTREIVPIIQYKVKNLVSFKNTITIKRQSSEFVNVVRSCIYEH